MSTTRLGPFTLDHRERLLWLGAEQVPVQPKVFDCLELLASRAGKLITNERLRAELWPEISVGDDAVRQLIAKARAALRAPGERPPTIRSRKGLGYVLEGEGVDELATDESSPPPIQHSHDWPVVGRGRELVAAREALTRAARGAGRLCLVSGEPGCGKSTLLDVLQQDATGLWLKGHCQAGLAQPPFWPFRELTQQLLRAAERDGALARAAKSLDACWKRSGVARVSGELQRPGNGEQRLIFAQALCDQLLELSRLRPVTLLLEDVHWADAGSLLLLELLARAAPQHVLVVFATYRHGQTSQNEPLRELLGRTLGRAGVSELRVLPLTTSELEALLGTLEHPYAGAGAAEALQRLTGGNALFVQLLLREGMQRSLVDEGLPSSLPHVVMERVQALPEPTRALLSVAAVLGSELALPLLGRVAQLSPTQLHERLAPALAAGLVSQPAGRLESLQFAHALVCDVLAQQLPGYVQRELHKRVVEALLQSSGELAESSALASHAYLAGDALPESQTRALCEQAGRECFAQLAFDRAVLHLTHALSLAKDSQGALARAELTLLHAQACWEADLSPELISAAFDDAATAARSAGSPRLLAETAIWTVVGPDSPAELYAARLRQEHVWRLEEAYALLGEGERTTRHRVARTLTWMHSSAGDVPLARRWAEATIESEGPSEPWTTTLALGIRCSQAIWSNQRAAALAVLDELRVHGHHPQLSLRERVDARLQLMAVCLWLGDGAGYRAAAAELSQLVRQLPQPPRFGRLGERFAAYTLIPTLSRMTEALLAGELATAHAQLSAVMAEATRLGLAALQGGEAGLLLVMPLLQYQGRSQMLQPMVEVARAAIGECGYRLALATMALEGGLLDAASAHFAVLRELGFCALVRGRRVPATPAQLSGLADLCVVLGDASDAEILREALLPSADFLAADGVVMSIGACARPLGELCCKLGRHEEAEQLLQRALALNQALGHRPELARTRLGQARLLLAQGRRDEAAGVCALVCAEAEAMGMSTLLEQSRGLVP